MVRRFVIVLIISLLSSLAGWSQEQPYSAPDSKMAAYYNEIAQKSGNIDTILLFSKLSLECCEARDLDLIASNYYGMGKAYYLQNVGKEALDATFKAVEYYLESGNMPELAKSYILVAKCYLDLNRQDSIFGFFNKALDIYEDLHDTANIAYVYQSVGAVNSDLGYYPTARDYYSKALSLDSMSGNYLELAFDYQNIGFVENEMGDKAEAFKYYKKSVSIIDTAHTDDPYYIYSRHATYIGLASAYIAFAKDTNEPLYADSCYMYLSKIGNFYIDNGNYSAEILYKICYAQYLTFRGDYNAAVRVLLDSRKYLDDDEGAVVFAQYYGLLSEVYEKSGDYRNSLECYKKMVEYQTNFANDSTMNALAKFQAEQEGKVQQAENRRLELEKSHLTTTVISLVAALALVAVLVFFLVRALKSKHRANEQLSVVNRKIYSSIVYAERIQKAAIPSPKDVDLVFPDNFVYYRPKHIVSGDFYFVAHCGRYKVLVTADCTGHGIPGALLSMLGISALKEFCVTEADADSPGVILDRMRNFIKSTLVANSNTDSYIGDGMDMTICCFDFEAMQMRYAIANQTALFISGGNVAKLKGDTMPVGRYVLEKEHFTTHTMPIKRGDVLYSFSDGIIDQPGGPITTDDKELAAIAGKKFSMKTLTAFLQSHYSLPLAEQCRIIDDTITEWRNGRPLIDDMTLVGIRI